VTSAAPAAAGARASLARVALIAVGIAALWALGRLSGGAVPAFAAWVERQGAWGAAGFVAGYAAATVAFVPGSLLTLAAGAIFGLARGTLYVLVAATLGAALAFLVARYAARPWVERRIASNPRFAAIDRAVGRQGRWIVFLLRLSPVVPFNLLNYALGLTRVRFADYLVASIGMLPGTLLYVYYGKLAGEVTALAGGAPAAAKGAGYYAWLGFGLAATIAVTAIVARIARRALDEAAVADSVKPGGTA